MEAAVASREEVAAAVVAWEEEVAAAEAARVEEVAAAEAALVEEVVAAIAAREEEVSAVKAGQTADDILVRVMLVVVMVLVDRIVQAAARIYEGQYVRPVGWVYRFYPV